MKGQRLYSTLLHVYPKPFRTHFGGEMLRLFQDCYPESGRAGFWLESVKDLAVSIPREWRREFCREDSSIDYTGIADALMCSIVAGTLLLGWGFLGASVAQELGVIAGKNILWVPVAGLLFTLVTITTAILVGVLGTFAAARSGRIDTTCSQLINYERTTARFSR